MYYLCTRNQKIATMEKKKQIWNEKNFSWDVESKCWYINEFHLQQTKACMESNRRLKARFPLTREEVVTNIMRINAMDKQKESDKISLSQSNVSDSTTNIIGT